jgi:glycosyltransferase involved in cell wall biosynthesis
VIIPFYNCAYLGQAIQSALDQTYPNIEVIVVDDGSTKHMEKAELFKDRIRYLRKENGGTGSALNEGIKHATGHYFSWLSSDDIYEPEKIERQVRFMRERDAVVSYTFYRYIDESNRIIGEPARPDLPTHFQFCRSMRRGCHINGCTVMAPLEVLSEAGLFDTSLRFAQDYDLWLRLLSRYEFHYLDEPLVRYRVHGEMTTKRFNDDVIAAEVSLVQCRYRRTLLHLTGRELLKGFFRR